MESLIIRGKKTLFPIIQGGMGVGVSRWPLASSVAREGGVGIISTAGLDRLVSKEIGRRVNTFEAVYLEVLKAKELSNNGLIGVNIMAFLQKDRDSAAEGAIAAEADLIISGAGIPLSLPKIKNPNTALIPIVSSLRVLEIILKKWEQLGSRPDAIVIEGPQAGGHLGFKFNEIDRAENRLENLLPPIKEFAMRHGDFPVIVAGGIYDHSDIQNFLNQGADGIQMGTRFMATDESGASEEYKQAVINSNEENIAVVKHSPCGFPIRVLTNSPMHQELATKSQANICDKGYLLQKDKEGKNTICLAKDDNNNYYCICNGLLYSAGYAIGSNLYTVGANASRVKEIISVKKLMNELKGFT